MRTFLFSVPFSTFCAESLKALIKSRQQSREREMDGFLDNLAAKYAPKAKKSKNSTAARKGKFPKKK
jgi:hypothetical protein